GRGAAADALGPELAILLHQPLGAGRQAGGEHRAGERVVGDMLGVEMMIGADPLDGLASFLDVSGPVDVVREVVADVVREPDPRPGLAGHLLAVLEGVGDPERALPGEIVAGDLPQPLLGAPRLADRAEGDRLRPADHAAEGPEVPAG